MRGRGAAVSFVFAVGAITVACSSSTGPGGSIGGHSATIVASATTTGGSYGSGGNYFFSPSPDSVAAGTAVTYSFGSVTHNVHFDAVTNAPDSVPASANTNVQRTFTTAGTYTYHCLIHNISGVVVVH
jgi:plastocyanin